MHHKCKGNGQAPQDEIPQLRINSKPQRNSNTPTLLQYVIQTRRETKHRTKECASAESLRTTRTYVATCTLSYEGKQYMLYSLHAVERATLVTASSLRYTYCQHWTRMH